MARQSTRTVFYIITLLIVVVLAQLTHGNAQESKGIIAELSDDYFEEALLDYNHAMVLFYSPRCSHCQDILPEFKMAADELIRNEPPVHAAMVNCKQGGKVVCQHEDISHLPTIKIFRRGTLYDEYDGKRDVQSIVSYLKKLVGITSEEIKLENIENFVEGQKEVVVVAILKEQGNLREHYFSLPAELSKDMRFGHVTMVPGQLAEVGVTLYYPQHMRSIFEPWVYKYDTKNEGYDLLEFVLSKRHGLVGLRTPRYVDNFAPPLVIIYYRYDINLKPKVFSYWRNRILKVAQKYQDYLHFAISGIDDFPNEFTKFGLSLPADDMMEIPLVFVILKDNTKYLLESEFTVETFDMFLSTVINGTAEPHLKSEPIPDEIPKKGNVQNVVAKNFRSVALQQDKDVLLEFYAPWCTICKEADGIMGQLAKMLANEDIIIVRMDATANEIPRGFDVPRYPTFYYIPKSPENSEPVLWDDGSSVTFDNLLYFIFEHATFDVSVFRKRRDEL